MGARLSAACEASEISVRTFQRWHKQTHHGEQLGVDRRTLRVFKPPNKLSEAERQKLIDTANSTEFSTLSPCQIVPILAERGKYFASESTWYRVLKEHKQLKHRHAFRPSTAKKPEPLLATAPNQLYSWDITYLPLAIKGTYCYLYLFLDVFSRYIVGWQVFDHESPDLAQGMLRDIVIQQGIKPSQVVLHSDNGGPMKGATMLSTMHELGIAASFSRPSVSDDNAYSEALFSTLKYRPNYPQERFDDIQKARDWVSEFVEWYNHLHRHSSIRFVTPAQRHTGEDVAILEARHQSYLTAREHHPERWSGMTRDWSWMGEVSLNPGRTSDSKKAQRHGCAMNQQ